MGQFPRLPRTLLLILLATAMSAGAQSGGIDYGEYDILTRGKVDDAGGVDYAALKKELPRLKKFVDQVAATSPESKPELFTDRSEQLRYYLTAYNAWVLYIAASEYPSNVSLWRYGLFRNRDIRLGGKASSLDDLEQVIARFEDPRVHFYLNRAAAGSPKFPRGAIQAGQVDRELDDAARRLINDRRYVRFDPATNELWLSRIFSWFEAELIKHVPPRKRPDPPHLSEYVLLYLEGPARAELGKVPQERIRIRYLEFSQSLNAVRRKPGTP